MMSKGRVADVILLDGMGIQEAAAAHDAGLQAG